MTSAELPQDPDRTILIPNPGGARPQSAVPPAAPIPPIPPAPAATAALPELPGSGLNPLVHAASPLLNLVLPLRSMPVCADIEALRLRLVEAIRSFETAAKVALVDIDGLAAARYALCTMIDETISLTPWGGGGAWANRSLLVTFHNEAFGGEKFFLVLQKLAQDPARNINVLELLYLCLALGFEGRYRLLDGGRGQLEQLREKLLQLIRSQRPPQETDLSPHWQGAAKPRQPLLSLMPLWIVLSVALLLLAVLHLTYYIRLGGAADPVLAGLHRIRLDLPRSAAIAAPLAPALKPRLAGFLQLEIQQGLVDVKETADRSVVTVRGENMFASGSADLEQPYVALMGRIGDALRTAPGQVSVIGHTDNRRGFSTRFPSNWELSKARAASAAQLLMQRAGPAERYRIEGRGDSEPVVNNDTPANRARNRRVEIVLLVPAGGS